MTKCSQLLLFIGGISALIIASCASNEKWNDIHTVKVAAKALAEKKVTATANGDTIITPPYDISVNMEFMDTTTLENADVCRKINKQLIHEFLEQDIEDGEKAVEIYIQRLLNIYKEEDACSEIYDHYNGKAEYGKEGVINYILAEDYFSGGAHPSQMTTILRFDAITGDKIGVYEFFNDTCRVALETKLTQRLMEKVGVPSLDSLHSLGYLAMCDIFISENFLLGKDSIHFLYNQYEIAPYSAGTTRISFSYDELKDLIRK